MTSTAASARGRRGGAGRGARHRHLRPEASELALHGEPGLPVGQLYRYAWLFYLILAIAGALWIGAQRGPISLSLFLDPRGWPLDLGLGAATGLGLLLLWRLGLRLSTGARALEESLAALLAGIRPPEVVGLAVLSGFAEELFFRGAVQGAWGWEIATLVFALVHIGPGRPFGLWAAFAAVAGAAFAGLMLWRENLLAPVAAHIVVNAVNLMRLARREPSEAA